MKTAHIWTKTIKSLQAHSLIPRFPYCSPSPHPPSHQVALNDRFTALPTKMAFECRKVSEGPCWAASWGGVTGHWTLKWAVSVTKGPSPLARLQGGCAPQPPSLPLCATLIKLGIALAQGCWEHQVVDSRDNRLHRSFVKNRRPHCMTYNI